MVRKWWEFARNSSLVWYIPYNTYLPKEQFRRRSWERVDLAVFQITQEFSCTSCCLLCYSFSSVPWTNSRWFCESEGPCLVSAKSVKEELNIECLTSERRALSTLSTPFRALMCVIPSHVNWFPGLLQGSLLHRWFVSREWELQPATGSKHTKWYWHHPALTCPRRW